MATTLLGRARLTLLQGGHGHGVPSDVDAPTRLQPCVMHDCPRPGEVQQVVRLGGREVPVLLCEGHARQDEQTIA